MERGGSLPNKKQSTTCLNLDKNFHYTTHQILIGEVVNFLVGLRTYRHQVKKVLRDELSAAFHNCTTAQKPVHMAMEFKF